jgi:hypothetical protein
MKIFFFKLEKDKELTCSIKLKLKKIIYIKKISLKMKK